MQEQINEKTVAISIKTARLTAEVLQKAMKKLLDARKHKAQIGRASCRERVF